MIFYYSTIFMQLFYRCNYWWFIIIIFIISDKQKNKYLNKLSTHYNIRSMQGHTYQEFVSLGRDKQIDLIN